MKQFSFSLDLTFSPETNEVIAALTPSFDKPAIKRDSLNSLLREKNYGEYFFHEERIEELLALDEVLREQGQKILLVTLKKLESTEEGQDKETLSPDSIFSLLNKELPSLVIAEKRDGEVEITTCEEDITAFITVHRPFGGTPANQDSINLAIEKAGIKADINQASVDRCIIEGAAENLPLAKGVKPKKGKDSLFLPLVEADIYKGPAIDQKTGKANFHDIYDFTVVEPGTELMRRGSPSDGKNGIDVFGKPIPAEPGTRLPFQADMEGACISEDDPDVIVATVKGHPIYFETGASVDNVLTLKNASLATGNVSFDGSVCIEEDVADGITIDATGDITVLGTVGKATLNAGNNISIKQGLIGGTKSSQGDTNEDLYGAFLKARGKVSVKFASYSKVEAGDEISLEEYATHCGLYADNKILLGKDTGTGSLIGGEAQAFETIYAKTLGSTGGAQTNLRVGAESNTLPSLRAVNQKLNANNRAISENAEKLNKLAIWAKVAGVNQQTRDKIANLNDENKALLEENLDLNKESDRLKKLLMRTKRSRIFVAKQAHQNVCVSMLNYGYQIKEDMTSGKFRFEAREIVFEK